jgi:quercetin dioxygenase-like cupin family protein
MRDRVRSSWWVLAVSSLFAVSGAGAAAGQEAAREPFGRNTADMKFVTIPALPTCSQAAVLSGDPTKGPSFLEVKVAAGCSIPWHWHTPNEQLMIVSGTARIDVKDGKALTLHPGGFAMMPSHHVHQFRCEGACAFAIHSDGAFDIHYVDGQGKELSPAEALKPLKETAATEMK